MDSPHVLHGVITITLLVHDSITDVKIWRIFWTKLKILHVILIIQIGNLRLQDGIQYIIYSEMQTKCISTIPDSSLDRTNFAVFHDSPSIRAGPAACVLSW